MDILNKSIVSITFEDVVSFCKEGVPEGIQIDYKENFPTKGFSKHLASFSNTRGGVIIIGVKENPKTGLPEVWDGIVNDAHKIESIHQNATNVQPIPAYTIHVTNEVEGKCFVLIRIYGGDNTPYYVQNDSNTWVRTGSVSQPIDIASPDGLELLFGKREKSKKARELCIRIGEETYTAALEREDKKRCRLIEEDERAGKNSGYYQKKLGLESLMCRIAIQPYFPVNALANPRDIKANLDQIKFASRHYSFPRENMEAIPQGLLHFDYSYNGYIESQQIYGQGMIFRHFDAVDVEENGKKTVRLWRVIGNFFAIMQFAKSFYGKFNYQGSLRGFISLENMVDVFVTRLKPSGRSYFEGDKQSFISAYKWEVDTDTQILNDPIEFKKYFFSFIREIYWHFGYEDVSDELLDDFLKESQLSF
jgi:hypothetical protein